MPANLNGELVIVILAASTSGVTKALSKFFMLASQEAFTFGYATILSHTSRRQRFYSKGVISRLAPLCSSARSNTYKGGLSQNGTLSQNISPRLIAALDTHGGVRIVPSLNIDIDYFDHPKTKRLVGLLGRNAEVLPLRLWSYCGKFHTRDGRLTGYSTHEIESIVGWWGKPDQFVEAMCVVRFLEKEKDGYVIHEWKEHQGHLFAFKVRGKKAATARWKRIKESCNKHASSNAKDMLEQCSNITKPTEHHPPNPPSGGNGQGPEKLPHAAPPEFWELAPENIRVESMREIWSEWVEYRRERKPKVTSRSAKMQLAELAQMGIEQATAAIRASIANGWQGIFPPRGSGKHVEAEDEFKPRAPTDDELKFLFPKEA